MWQYIQYNQLINSIVQDKEQFLDYLKKTGASDKCLKSIEFIDYALDKGLINAVEKFKEWLVPQEIVRNKQVSIFNF
jgi:hypothetical protein